MTLQPLAAKKGVLQGVLINRSPAVIVPERDELPEKSLLSHPELLAKPLGGGVRVFHVGIQPARC
jgi:hypothetical protein